MMCIELRGCPPSLNQFAGRENSWEYRKAKSYWTQLVWATCLSCKERPKAPYELADVEIMYYFPTRTRHDADNYCGKFLLDGLTKAEVIADDSMDHIRLHIAGGYDKRRPRTVITVRDETICDCSLIKRFDETGGPYYVCSFCKEAIYIAGEDYEKNRYYYCPICGKIVV